MDLRKGDVKILVNMKKVFARVVLSIFCAVILPSGKRERRTQRAVTMKSLVVV